MVLFPWHTGFKLKKMSSLHQSFEEYLQSGLQHTGGLFIQILIYSSHVPLQTRELTALIQNLTFTFPGHFFLYLYLDVWSVNPVFLAVVALVHHAPPQEQEQGCKLTKELNQSMQDVEMVHTESKGLVLLLIKRHCRCFFNDMLSW